MDLPDLNLSKKIGPLPLSAWIAVIGLGLAGAWLLQRRSGGGPAVASTSPSGEGLTYSDPLAGGGYSPGAGGLDPYTPISTVDEGPQSNHEWVLKAAKTLQMLRRPWSDSKVLAALRNYVDGRPAKTTEDQQIVDDALKQYGYPPEQIIADETPTPTAPAPGSTGTAGYERIPPDQVPKAKLGHRYTRVQQIGTGTNARGERPDEIARRVYGSSKYAQTLDYVNGAFAGGYTKPLPIGIQIAY